MSNQKYNIAISKSLFQLGFHELKIYCGMKRVVPTYWTMYIVHKINNNLFEMKPKQK